MGFEIEKDTDICDITFHCKRLIVEDDKKRLILEFDDEVLKGISNGDFSTVQRLIFTNGKKQYMFSKFREENMEGVDGS